MDPQLYVAASKGYIRELEGRDDIHVQLTPKENTVLHVAAQFGRAACVKWILLRSPSLLQRPNEKGDTPLHLAAREGHLKVVQNLIEAAKNRVSGNVERGAAADCKNMVMRMRNREQDTALHEAVRYHHPDVVKLLIQEDPDFTYGPNAEGKTPLYIAAEWGFRDLVEMIIDKCSSPDYSGIHGRTALHAAVILNDEAMTKRILNKRPDSTQKLDDKGWSPLHFAAYVNCDRTIVSLLLEKSDPTIVYLGLKEHGNRTALHVAASRGHLGIVKELVSRFPDCCEKVDDEGNNVLHLIMPKYKYTISRLPYVSWLRLKGLMNEKNVKGKTPLDLLHDSPMFRGDKFITLEGKSVALIMEESVRLLRKWSPSFRINLKPLGSLEIGEDSDSSESQGGEEEVEEMKKTMKTHMIVATLIATVTFAAAFTLPGGYIQDDGKNQGMAILSLSRNYGSNGEEQRMANKERKSFRLFVIADSMAMVLSVCAVGIYFLAALPIKKKVIIQICLYYGLILTMSAMSAMVVAFHAGLQAVLVRSPLLEDATSFMFPLFYVLFLLPCAYIFLPPKAILRVFCAFTVKFPVTIKYWGRTCYLN